MAGQRKRVSGRRPVVRHAARALGLMRVASSPGCAALSPSAVCRGLAGARHEAGAARTAGQGRHAARAALGRPAPLPTRAAQPRAPLKSGSDSITAGPCSGEALPSADFGFAPPAPPSSRGVPDGDLAPGCAAGRRRRAKREGSAGRMPRAEGERTAGAGGRAQGERGATRGAAAGPAAQRSGSAQLAPRRAQARHG